VFWSAALHGIQQKASSKSDTMRELIEYQCLPIPWKQMEYMVDAWFALDESARSEIRNAPACTHAKKIHVGPHPDDASTSDYEDDVLGGGKALPHGRTDVPDDPPKSTPSESSALAALLAKAIDALGNRPAPSPLEVRPSEDPVERTLDKARKALLGGYYIDIMHLSKSNMDKLRFKGLSPSGDTLRIVNGNLTTSSCADTDLASSYNWREFASAFSEYVILMLATREVAHLVEDRLRWFQEVSQYRNVRDDQRTKYCKYFMCQYAGFAPWLPLFHSDSSLLLQYLPISTVAEPFNLGDAHARSQLRRDRQSGTGSGSKRQQTSPSHGAPGGKKPKHSPAGKKKKHRYCFTRSDPSLGACPHGTKCRFDHNCASCGKDHTAADCSAWDQATADKNLE
jgi:hypothetical protein